jgi:triosephosphate isomerase
MNTTISEGLALVDAMLPELQSYSAVERVVCPPFVSLSAIADRLRGTGIDVGAQNMYAEPQGAFTGEIAPTMLEGLASFVILGHSERRQYFCEDDTLVNRKVKAALLAGLVPIVCVGETAEQNDRGETETVVTRQVRSALDAVEHLSAIVIAYEPIWAIGTGRAATPEGANATIAVIRELCRVHCPARDRRRAGRRREPQSRSVPRDRASGELAVSRQPSAVSCQHQDSVLRRNAASKSRLAANGAC